MLFGLGKPEAILAAGFELFATRGFHRKHPLAISFLENRHHGAYLDQVSRVLERVPEPIVALIDRMSRNKIAKGLPRMILATVIWGTFVELVKLESQDLLSLSRDTLKAAEDSTWDAIRADHAVRR